MPQPISHIDADIIFLFRHFLCHADADVARRRRLLPLARFRRARDAALLADAGAAIMPPFAAARHFR